MFKPKIIIIAGHSGSGKSTVAVHLTTFLPNSKIICYDQFMYKAIISNPEIFEKLFDVPIDTDCGHSYMIKVINEGKMTFINHRIFCETVLPYVESEATVELEKIKREHKYDFIITEWGGSSSFKKLWKNACFRIHVKPASDEMHEFMLAKRSDREGANEQAKEEARIRRDSIRHLIDYAQNVDFTIINSYDQSLFEDIKECAYIIKDFKKCEK